MADLFSGEDTTNVDPNKDYLVELVGEGKKFATPQDLARGKAEADLFIARITAENAQYREEVSKRKTLEEIRDQIVSLQANAPPPNNPPNQRDEPPENTLFDQTKVEALVAKRFEQLTKEQREEANLASVVVVLTDKFGAGYQADVKARADELGLGQNYLTNLAKEQPKAFLALMGEVNTSPSERVNTGRGPLPQTGGKGWSYFEEIRKRDFHKYNTPAVQNEMFKALAAQGEDFYNK